ncbi:MAG: AAA family ATPase [Clostridiales bacterium]|jgi:cytidylate kinase|nr:AAA family ATPase [Clostridiales bacterium]
MHITITGNLGSGKSTVARILSEKYSFEVYSTGKIQRELAKQMNLSTLELNQLMMSDRKYDNMIDDETARISRENKNKNIIFDSRLAWNFVEFSFKVFVTVSLDVAAYRVMNDQRGSVEKYSSIEEAKTLLAERANTERIRYKDIYNLNYMDFTNYNLIIDGTYCDPDTMADIIMEEAKDFYTNSQKATKRLVSPKCLIFKDFNEEEDKSRLDDMIKSLKSIAYIKDKTFKVKKQDGGFHVKEDIDLAKASLLAHVSYIQIEILED